MSYIYIYFISFYIYICIFVSVCLYVYTLLCARHSGWTQRGLNPRGGGGYRFEMKIISNQGGPKPVRNEKSCELYPVSLQYIAKANRTPASKLAFVIRGLLKRSCTAILPGDPLWRPCTETLNGDPVAEVSYRDLANRAL